MAAVRAATEYDGSEPAYEAVMRTLEAFEECAKELTQIDYQLGRERRLSRQLTGQRLTVDGLLELAIRSFNENLRSGRHRVQSVATGIVFLPTQREIQPLTGSGTGWEVPRTEPRLVNFIAWLNENRIYTDDIMILEGAVAPDMMRKSPYCIVQIPRLDREVAICDEVGEATFVGTGLRGAYFWATCHKPELLQSDGISRIIHNEKFVDNLQAALFKDNVIQAKVKLSRDQNFKLTADVILHKALEVAHEHFMKTSKWRLPTTHDSEVPGWSGRTWGAVNVIIHRKLLGFDIEDLKGLGDLFNHFGLKKGQTIDAKKCATAWANIQRTGHHGLQWQNAFKLTSNLILYKVLEVAREHFVNTGEWRLPVAYDGVISDFSGRTWKSIDSAIRKQSFGFEIKGLRGLGDFYRYFGLKGEKEGLNIPLILQACQNLRDIKHHGLFLIPTRQDHAGHKASGARAAFSTQNNQ